MSMGAAFFVRPEEQDLAPVEGSTRTVSYLVREMKPVCRESFPSLTIKTWIPHWDDDPWE